MSEPGTGWTGANTLQPKEIPLPPRVALFGAGRVGTAVTVLLQRAGSDVVGVRSRTQDSATRASEMLGCPVLDGAALVEADLFIIGASDQAIADVAGVVSQVAGPDAVVAHLSGSLGIGALMTVAEAGASPLAIHPVQACPDVATAIERLPGSAWGVTAPAEIEDWAHRLVTEILDGRPVGVAESDRPLWHAACVMTSNGIAALMAFGESLLDAVGIDDAEGVLGPLAAGTVANARSGGGGAATLTGPVLRGEADTVGRHLDLLAARFPDKADEYRQVARLILTAAVMSGRLDADSARSLEETIR
jgi:predicted short-subunit dehydrogenase-like oxidoreductase (DUF2520 family)